MALRRLAHHHGAQLAVVADEDDLLGAEQHGQQALGLCGLRGLVDEHLRGSRIVVQREAEACLGCLARSCRGLLLRIHAAAGCALLQAVPFGCQNLRAQLDCMQRTWAHHEHAQAGLSITSQAELHHPSAGATEPMLNMTSLTTSFIHKSHRCFSSTCCALCSSHRYTVQIHGYIATTPQVHSTAHGTAQSHVLPTSQTHTSRAIRAPQGTHACAGACRQRQCR